MKLISAAMAQDANPPAAPAPAPTAPTAPTPPTPAAPAPPTPPTTTSVGAPQPVDPNAPPPPNVPEMLQQLIPIFVVMGIVYIMVIRPRARKEREEAAALRNVRRGDIVATTSGFVGKVTRAIDDDEVEFEIAPNVRARLLRSAITEVRSRGEPVRDEAPKETSKEAPKAVETKPETKPDQRPARARGGKPGART